MAITNFLEMDFQVGFNSNRRTSCSKGKEAVLIRLCKSLMTVRLQIRCVERNGYVRVGRNEQRWCC